MATTNASLSPTGIDVAEKLAAFSEPWQPRVVGQINRHDLMVAKLKGEFTRHTYDVTDDFFLVPKGSVTIRMRESVVTLGPGSSTSCRGAWRIARWWRRGRRCC
jgi:mannose-6-phosphate isomerase-like protein (cupin superfamily)